MSTANKTLRSGTRFTSLSRRQAFLVLALTTGSIISRLTVSVGQAPKLSRGISAGKGDGDLALDTRVAAFRYVLKLDYKMQYKIAEIPIIFYERDLGLSKIDLPIIAEAFLGVPRLRMRFLNDRMMPVRPRRKQLTA